MRIGIDGRELSGHPTGAGRYLAGLLREWGADHRARNHEFVLYAPGAPAIPLDARLFATRLVPGVPGTWWEQMLMPRVARSDHLDVFFAPAYTAPLRLAIPTVVTIFDLSYAAHPEWFRPREGLRRRFVTRQTARRATSVITISEFSRREIIERLGVPGSRLSVIPPGIESPAVPAAARADPRVLYVGSIFNRRHVPDLIRAFGEDIAAAIERSGLTDRIRWHRYASEQQLGELYSRARAFAFLSEYEGLGMTPLEALSSGIPPVVLDTAVAREACGDAALFVPCEDLPATTRALEAAVFDEPTRARVLAAAPAALRKYDWPRAGRETLKVLEDAASA